ncbi:hypothetical protein V494_08101 [Pseudogymnoascus sp. VKM F-4513 (FW-928)]|nr:hypothetical protein V494_08101 [Pseudogymnoascus sp. VKM F-4513 (FW-928)]
MPSGPHEVAAKRFSDLLFLKSKKQQQAIEAFIAGMRDRLSGEPDGPFEGGIPEVGWMGNKPYRATL